MNREQQQSCRRITVKVGSNVLTRADGTLDVTRMSALVDQVAGLRQAGLEVILVSSGAVASGRSEVRPVRKLDSVDQRQLFSAVGQAKLINRYYELFREHGIAVGQVLTTKESLGTRGHYLNQKNCMTVMHGIYDGPPSDPASRVIPLVRPGDDLASCIQASKSSFGRGGMSTKTGIARKVADEGVTVIIANGRRENVLTELLLTDNPGIPHTRFVPAPRPASSVKKWIAHSEGFAKGAYHVSRETMDVLLSDQPASILPVGILAVEGQFDKDDIVRIYGPDNRYIGVGKSAFSSGEVSRLIGKHGQRPAVHYDYLYIE